MTSASAAVQPRHVDQPTRPRRLAQQQKQRQRRAQRELQQALRERAEQDAAPRNDPVLLPRID